MSDWILIEGKGLVYWPMCPIKDCPNRICYAEGSNYCWPHTGSGKTYKELIDEWVICTANAVKAFDVIYCPKDHTHESQ